MITSSQSWAGGSHHHRVGQGDHIITEWDRGITSSQSGTGGSHHHRVGQGDHIITELGRGITSSQSGTGGSHHHRVGQGDHIITELGRGITSSQSTDLFNGQLNVPYINIYTITMFHLLTTFNKKTKKGHAINLEKNKGHLNYWGVTYYTFLETSNKWFSIVQWFLNCL